MTPTRPATTSPPLPADCSRPSTTPPPSRTNSTTKHRLDRRGGRRRRRNRDLVWVGTGEANPRNSVSFGDGVYLSTDGGKTWQNKGLKKSYQIGKIVIHPKDHNIVYVAALGRLYGPSDERGLYKTTDGGKTWQRVWFLDDKTGVLDIAMNPTNPDMLLLTAWERRRDEFDSFLGDAKVPPAADMYAPVKAHAPGSGIYKSSDGGATWTRVTHGLPNANLGRIGLDWQRKNPKVVLAIVDSDEAGTGLAPSKGFLGLRPENTSEGVRVADVQKDSPAAKAKLAKGDRLLTLDGKDVKKTDDFLLALQPRSPGDKIKLAYQQGDKKETAEITLADRPGTGGKGKKNRGTLGVQVEETEDGVILTEISRRRQRPQSRPEGWRCIAQPGWPRDRHHADTVQDAAGQKNRRQP